MLTPKMSLDDELRFEKLQQVLKIDCLPLKPKQANKAGLSWIAVPRDCIGIAFVTSGDCQLLCVNVEAEGCVKTLFRHTLPTPAVRITASHDGRLVVVALSDGSLQCFNVADNKFTLRWGAVDAHSHVAIDVAEAVSSSRNNAASPAGPISTLQFSPDSYELLLVDSSSGSLTIFHGDSTDAARNDGDLSDVFVTCANWSHDSSKTIIVGSNDGKVLFYNYKDNKLSLTNQFSHPSNDTDWVCTHLNWFQIDTIAAGYCRVIASEDESESNEGPPDLDDEDEVQTDNADHEASMIICTVDNSLNVTAHSDLEDVVAFFFVPKHGRHVFYTSSIPTATSSSLLVVASNVSNDIAICHKRDDQSWDKCDMPENNNVVAPIVDYEFSFPVGLQAVKVYKEHQACLFVFTDGSVEAWKGENDFNDAFFTKESRQTTFLPSSPVETKQYESIDNTSDESKASLPEPKAAVPSQTPSGLVFGSGSESKPTVPSQSSSGFAFGSGPELKPTLPSQTSSGFVFGAGTSGPIFGSSTSKFDFSSLGKATLPIPSTPTSVFPSSFDIFGKQKPTSPPLFGSPLPQSSAEVSNVAPNTTGPVTKNEEETKEEPMSPTDKKAVSAASRAFDSIDTDKSGYVSRDNIDDVLEVLGEGFYGEELDSQIIKMKPDDNKINRSSFINWYVDWLKSIDDDGDDESIDSEEMREREEEAEGARKAFSGIAKNDGGNMYVDETQFEQLFEELGSTYCEEEHVKPLKRISKNGKLYIEDFIDWYVGWVFGGDDSSSDEPDVIDKKPDQGNDAKSSTKTSVGQGWGDIFGQKSGWRCATCMVENDTAATKCAACETPKPGAEKEKSTSVSTPNDKLNDKAASAPAFSFGFSAPTSQPVVKPTEVTQAKPSQGFTFGFNSTFATALEIPATAPETKSTAQIKSSTDESKQEAIGPNRAVAYSAFDVIDKKKSGTVGISQIEDILEELGENFHGDELEKQTSQMDPKRTGVVTRSSFADWYCNLLDTSKNDNDDESLDSDEKQERQEEKEKAETAFLKIARKEGERWCISINDFSKLFEALGTTYCEEEHTSTIKKIGTKSGLVYLEDFTNWYIDWLYNDNDSEDNDEEEEKSVPPGTTIKDSSTGWGDTFKKAEGSWKCSACMVSNDADKNVCVACETPKSGTLAVKTEKPAVESSASQFMKPSESSSATFSFGFQPAVSKSNPPGISGQTSQIPFSFSSPSPPAPTMFSFKTTTSSTDARDGAKTIGGSAYPPIASSAPTMFGKPTAASSANATSGGSELKPSTSTSGSAYPPIASSAPTMFGKSTATKASSAYPPIASSAPTMFGKPAATSSSNAISGGTSKASSAYPPIASSAPTMFGKPTAASSTKATSNIGLQTKFAGKVTFSDESLSSREKLSSISTTRGGCYDEYVNLVKTCDSLLARSARTLNTHGIGALSRDVKLMTDEVQDIFGSFVDFQSSIAQFKLRCATILSKREESSAELKLSELMVNEINGNGDLSSVLSMPLDMASEMLRRRLASSSMYFHNLWDVAKRQIVVIECLCYDNSRVVFFEEAYKVRNMVSSFYEEACRIEKKAYNLLTTTSSPKVYSQSRSQDKINTGTSSKKRSGQSSNVIVTALATQFTDHNDKWRTFESKFKHLKLHSTYSELDLLQASGSTDERAIKPIKSVQNNSYSPAQSHSNSIITSHKHRSHQIPPALRLKPRQGWDTPSRVDQEKLQNTSFAPPKQLNEISVQDYAREALADFGTTPEKVRENISLEKSGFKQLRSTDLSVTEQNHPALQKSSQTSQDGTMQRPMKSIDEKNPAQSLTSSNRSPHSLRDTSIANEGRASTNVQSQNEFAGVNLPQSSSQSLKAGLFGSKKASFADMSGLGSALSSSGVNTNQTQSSNKSIELPLPQGYSPAKSSGPDYERVLESFYEKHNPSRLHEVQKTLEKYQGREPEMFSKLAKKYGVQNPLSREGTSNLESTKATATIDQHSKASTASLSAPAFMQAKSEHFGLNFGAGTQSTSSINSAHVRQPENSQSPFGIPTNSTTTGFSGFGNSSMTPAAAAPSFSSPSPFGQPNPSTSAPSFAPTTSTMTPPPQTGGRSPREMLTAFYQQYNPSKVSEVDSFLQKYAGNEEQLFRNLAKKYNLDPKIFGLPALVAPGGIAASVGGFGQPSSLGGGSTFSSPTPFGGTGIGGTNFAHYSGGPSNSGFGSALSSNFSGPSFGSLASSPAPAAFGSPSVNSPFGGPRR